MGPPGLILTCTSCVRMDSKYSARSSSTGLTCGPAPTCLLHTSRQKYVMPRHEIANTFFDLITPAAMFIRSSGMPLSKALTAFSPAALKGIRFSLASIYHVCVCGEGVDYV